MSAGGRAGGRCNQATARHDHIKTPSLGQKLEQLTIEECGLSQQIDDVTHNHEVSY